MIQEVAPRAEDSMYGFTGQEKYFSILTAGVGPSHQACANRLVKTLLSPMVSVVAEVQSGSELVGAFVVNQVTLSKPKNKTELNHKKVYK